VWRLGAGDGGLDPGFNQVGYMTHHGAAGGNGNDTGYGVILHDDKLLVVGSSAGTANDNEMTIWRLDAQGRLDTSFNGTGSFSHEAEGGGVGYAVAVGPKEQILVAGSSNGDVAAWCLSTGP
jgi:hypothetical protein